MKLTQKQRDEIFDKAKLCFITLNAEPAKLYGRKLDFPIIKIPLWKLSIHGKQ